MHVAGPGIVIYGAVDDDGPRLDEPGQAGNPLPEPGQVGCLTGQGSQSDRVDTQVQRQFGVGLVACLEDRQQRLSRSFLIGSAGDFDLSQIQQHIGQHRAHIGRCDGIWIHPQPKAGRSTFQIGADGCPGDGRVGVLVQGSHIPRVHRPAAHRSAPLERHDRRHAKLAGHSVSGIDRLDDQPVDRPIAQPFYRLVCA